MIWPGIMAFKTHLIKFIINFYVAKIYNAMELSAGIKDNSYIIGEDKRQFIHIKYLMNFSREKDCKFIAFRFDDIV